MPKPILQVNVTLAPCFDEDAPFESVLSEHYTVVYANSGPPLAFVTPDPSRLERIATAALQGLLAGGDCESGTLSFWAVEYAKDLITELDKAQQ